MHAAAVAAAIIANGVSPAGVVDPVSAPCLYPGSQDCEWAQGRWCDEMRSPVDRRHRKQVGWLRLAHGCAVDLAWRWRCLVLTT